MAKRTPRKEQTKVDLTIPIDVLSIVTDGCFGVAYDASNRFCQLCSDNLLCSIKVGSKVTHTHTDEPDLDKSLLNYIKSGITTTKQLVTKIQQLYGISDKKEATSKAIKWIKGNSAVYTKDKKVWLREK